VTPAPGSVSVALGRMFCTRAARAAALGERSWKAEKLGDEAGTGAGVRLMRVVR